jgi:hypothetical protein
MGCVLSFQKEGAVGITPCQDKCEMCFEYVDVVEGQFTTQEHELHFKNVDTLLIKEEVPTKQENKMFSENMTASSVKEHPFTQEPRGYFENVDASGQGEYGMGSSSIDITSIKKEPADEVNITQDPSSVGENETVDALSIKKEQCMKEEEDPCFANTAQMKEGETENIITAEQSSRGVNGTFFENDSTIHIKEEHTEIHENSSCISIKEHYFTAQDIEMCSMSVDLKSVNGEQLTDECFAIVNVKEEEITFPEQENTETDEVFRLVHCLYLLHFLIVIYRRGVTR